MKRKNLTPNQRAAQVKRIRTRLVATAAILVGAGALWVSYWHIHDVTMGVGEDKVAALLMPLTVDGLMLVSGLAVAEGRAKRQRPWLAYLGFTLGLVASLAANVLSSDGSVVGLAVAGWPAITVAITSEITLRLALGHRPKPRKRSKPKGTGTGSHRATSNGQGAVTELAPVRVG